MLPQTCSTLLFNSASSFNMWLHPSGERFFYFLYHNHISRKQHILWISMLHLLQDFQEPFLEMLTRNIYESLLAAESSQSAELQFLVSSSPNVWGLSLPPTWFAKHVARVSLPSQQNHLDTITLSSKCFEFFRSLKLKISLCLIRLVHPERS